MHTHTLFDQIDPGLVEFYQHLAAQVLITHLSRPRARGQVIGKLFRLPGGNSYVSPVSNVLIGFRIIPFNKEVIYEK